MFSISNVVIIVVETYVRFFQFSSRWYLCARESPYYAPHPFAQKVSQRCLSNSSNVRLNDDGPLSSFQGRSSSASHFHASLLQAVDGVMPLPAGGVSRSSTLQIFREASHLWWLLCPSVYLLGHYPSVTPACPVQHTHSRQEFSKVAVDH